MSSLDRVSKGLRCVGSICLKGFDLCVLKHQIVSRSKLKIDHSSPKAIVVCRDNARLFEFVNQATITWGLTYKLQLLGRLLQSQIHPKINKSEVCKRAENTRTHTNMDKYAPC